MTAIEEKPEAAPVPEGHVRLTIDGVEVIAPKGELLIRTAERLGMPLSTAKERLVRGMQGYRTALRRLLGGGDETLAGET